MSRDFVSEDYFVNCLRKFYKHITKKTIVPFDKEQLPSKKEDLFKSLRKDILNQTYQPSLPREYIIFPKSNSVARFVPTFTLRDYCVYFFCINQLQDGLCNPKNRVKGTFGGWRISNNSIKLSEDEEKQALYDEIDDYIHYISISSMSVQEWLKNYKEFSKLSYATLKNYSQLNPDGIIVCFDIANFYDNIKLDILEKKIRSDKNMGSNASATIDLLMYFLKYWNKPFEGYAPKSVGIPQEETSDCSRILANFYLNSYDKNIKEICDNNNCQYIRYADDMTIFAPSLELAEKMLFEASKELHKLGLNINSGKVHFFNYHEYSVYQCFDILELLNMENSFALNKAIEILLDRLNNKNKIHYGKCLRRLLTVITKLGVNSIKNPYKEDIIKWMFDKKNIVECDCFYLKKLHIIASQLNKEKEFFEYLHSFIFSTNFNSYHYQLLHFYKEINHDFDNKTLQQEIDKRKIIHLE